MNSLNEAVRLLQSNRDRLIEFSVRKIGLFGSLVRNEQSAESDVDVLVDLVNVTFENYMGLLFHLENIFGCRVDLVTIKSIKAAVREGILAEAVYVDLY